MTIERYTSAMQEEWNLFVKQSKNGTFLFDRNYMDYHSDRFVDFSLVCRNDKGHIIALLPANKVDTTLYSHQGLTYGGLVINSKTVTKDVFQIFQEMNLFLAKEGITKVIYKPVPSVYHTLPSDEDLFTIVNICGARLTKRMLSTVVDLGRRIPLRQNRRTALNKAHAEGIVVTESTDFGSFWAILEENLRNTYESKPVHSLEEIKRLHHDNPGHIRLFLGSKKGELLGGIVVYEMEEATHTQYISANEKGKHLGVVDAIMNHIMETSTKHFLDIGTSAGENGALLNTSLLFQKEGFGGRGICYDTYEWEINN